MTMTIEVDVEGDVLARSEARIFTGIWQDQHFLALPPSAQWLYLFLVSQADLSHCGVIPLRLSRWARKARGVTLEQLQADLALLAEAQPRPFVVIDEESGELLIRSLIRRDKVLRQPFLFPRLAEAVDGVESGAILAALYVEMRRALDEGEVNERLLEPLERLLGSLRRRVPDRHSDRDSATHPETHPDTHLGKPGGPAGQNGASQGLPQANTLSGTHADRDAESHPDTQQGVGGIGEYLDTPLSPNPESPSPTPRAAPHDPAADGPADATEGSPEGEGEDHPDDGQRLTALVAEVKAIRPEWSERSIRRALTVPSVAERPPAIIRGAILAVARDRASQAPGRLEHDGPWWRSAAPAPPPPATERCEIHLLEQPCRSCAADRKAAP